MKKSTHPVIFSKPAAVPNATYSLIFNALPVSQLFISKMCKLLHILVQYNSSLSTNCNTSIDMNFVYIHGVKPPPP